MFVFKSLDIVKIEGRGTSCVVKNPVECHDFKHLQGEEVEIDGKIYKVKGVECFMHNKPWREGESIGLLV